MKKLTSIAAAMTLMATALQAQTVVTAQLTQPFAPGGGAVTSPFGYYMSPYTGTIDGGAPIRFNCVDYFHDVAVGQVWQATSTNLGDIVRAAQANDADALNLLLANTRDGSNGAYSPTAAVAVYQQVAFLTTQYDANPATNVARTSAIQTAIWAITSGAFDPTFPTAQWINGLGDQSTAYWIAQASAQYNQQVAGYYDQFNILTDVNHLNGGAQEFIYATSTPEPATLTLLASGLAGVGGFGFRRRRKKAA